MNDSQKNIPVHIGRVPFIEHGHVEVHEGESFISSHRKAANDAETLEIFFKPSGTRNLMHVLVYASSLLTATWDLYEGTTKTYNATNVLAAKNRFRGHSNTPPSDVQICHTPGGSGDGTWIDGGFCGAGIGPQSPGGEGRSEGELILWPNKKYLLRITSSANSNQLQGKLDFYHHYHGDAPVTTTTTTTTTTTSTTTTTA